MKRLIFCAVGLLASLLTSISQAQELLTNPGFELPAVTTPCVRDTQAITGWTTGGPDRNDTQFTPTCPRVPGDTAYISKQANGPTPAARVIRQTVNGLTAGTSYTFTGYWAFGVENADGTITAAAELHDGTDFQATAPPLLIARSTASLNSGSVNWQPFSVTGTAASSQMTVVLSVFNSSSANWGFHANDCSLQVTTCTAPPAITGVAPNHAARGTTPSLSITGSNFVDGQTSVMLTRSGQSDIAATGILVSGGGESLTCNVNLTGAATGPWNVVVTNNTPGQNCTPAVKPNGFLVILPSFNNGSFELPTAAGGCPATPLLGTPTDWLYTLITNYGDANALIRDFTTFPPTCPPPDGAHYGSTSSTANANAGAEADIYQTISATPGTDYAFSGMFAGGGSNVVTIELHDGDRTGLPLGTTSIHQSTQGSYNWTFAYVHGTPTLDYLTVLWRVKLAGSKPHAAHADNLALEACLSPGSLSLATVNPTQAINAGMLHATITGTGFTGTPTVSLTTNGTALQATNVQVQNPNQLTCDFNVDGISSGRYLVVLKSGGCIVSDPSVAVLVVAAQFVNGSFESPTATINCGPPPVLLTTIPTGWNSDAGLGRNGNAPLPPSCPNPTDGGNYGFMSSEDGGILRAWQTVLVTPGTRYDLKGQFGGSGTCILRLKNGDENGPDLASSTVFAGGDGGVWVPGSVGAVATWDVMTVMWEIDNAAPGGMADGLTFGPGCHTAWADSDNDGDVDPDDFGVFQRCYTGISGPIPSSPEYCVCFDRNDNGLINETDFALFQGCTSGAGVPIAGCP